MCIEDFCRVWTTHEPHVAELLEAQGRFCDLLDLVEVEGLTRRGIGDGDESTGEESGGEVVEDAGEEMAAKVVTDGMDCVELLVVEDVDNLCGHLVAFVVCGRRGLVGGAVAEEVGDKDSIAVVGEMGDLIAPVIGR